MTVAERLGGHWWRRWAMPTPEQYRRGLVLVTDRAVQAGQSRLGAPVDDLVADTTDLVAYYSDGTAALAADQYDELRDAARPAGRWTAEPVVPLRPEKIRVGVLWAVDPLGWTEPDQPLAAERLAEVIRLETARPFYETTTINTRRDPSGVGWQRLPNPKACKFCSFLAGRGAVYRAETARFAAHPGCGCSAVPVFKGQQAGPPASALQYVASQRTRTPAQQQRLREALAAMP